jgi:glycosyltransferase involved in cell wall biosynthesis
MDDMPVAVLRQGPDSARDIEPIRCRLLYLVGQLVLGGLERQLTYLLATLDHARYQPALVVWNLNPNEKYYRDIQALQVPIYGFPAEWSPTSKLRAFRKLTLRLAPEVIHSYGFNTNFAAYYAARGTSALAIGSLRSDFVAEKKAGGVLRGALNARWPSFQISNSMASAEVARRNSSFFAPKQFSIVRNGLDLNRFRVLNEIRERKTYVAAIGWLLPVKRWDRLLRAIHEMKTKVGEVDFRIAGDGPLRPALEEMARTLDISETVKFMGAVDDISSFLRQAKVLVHTSETEGCPNVVMEAMACGVPVVAMEAGDISYLVEEGRTGFVVRQDDEEGLADRITQLLTDERLALNMSVAGREKAERDFGLQRLVSETLSAYKIAGWRDK